jgi:molybdate transport system substrate-binding protein
MIVELDEVEIGIVYRTDALKSKKVKIVSEIPTNLHQPIGYYATIIKSETNNDTEQFFNFIVSEKTKPIWQKHGFIIE